MSDALKPGDSFNPYRMFVGLFIPEGLARCKGISSGAKLTWGRLARYAGENGNCYPTMKTLGAEIGVGERQAQKYVVELEEAKLIRRKSRFASGAQTSNGFEFLWHDIFGRGANDSSGEGVNNSSPRGANDRSPKESQTEESHSEERKTDLDCLPLNRKERDSPAGDGPASVCKRYPNVQACLARYMQLPGDEKEYPSDRTVVDIMDAASTHDEREVIAALNYLYFERGLKPFSKNGPRSFAWFKTVLQDYFEKRSDREEGANPSGFYERQERNETRLAKTEFDSMTDAIELPASGY